MNTIRHVYPSSELWVGSPHFRPTKELGLYHHLPTMSRGNKRVSNMITKHGSIPVQNLRLLEYLLVDNFIIKEFKRPEYKKCTDRLKYMTKFKRAVELMIWYGYLKIFNTTNDQFCIIKIRMKNDIQDIKKHKISMCLVFTKHISTKNKNHHTLINLIYKYIFIPSKNDYLKLIEFEYIYNKAIRDKVNNTRLFNGTYV